MTLETSEDLLAALQQSGLFTAEQFEEIVRDLNPSQGTAESLMKRLVRREQITVYQLKKVLHGKADELQVGSYIVTDKLGEGGMGKVFRARHRGTGETVALKVVRSALIANLVVRGRYAREVQTASTLAHPNIVRLYDSGEADGRFYLAMEFVDGIDLARLMHDFGKLEVAEACEYTRQIALGLQHAHEKGFVHRDIKPSNIVVAGERHLPQATEPAIVKILDLGLARAIDPDDMVMPNLTRDHTVVGTPDYMAPEQAKNSKTPDPRSDLYSLGCALYFLLSGQVPFSGRGPIEKIIAHQTQLPQPLLSLRPEVPRGVIELIERLMAKRPEDRIQTAGELAAALEPYTHYAADAPPIRSVRERAAKTDGDPVSTSMGAGTVVPSGASSLGPFSHLALSTVDLPSTPQPQSIAPSDRTPQPRTPSTDKRSQRRPRAKAQSSSRKRRRTKRTSREKWGEVPQFVWVAVALLGLCIVVGMLLVLAYL